MPDENPLVSIIIPTYNRAHLIGETLDSVLAQTYPYRECIVVDDGGTDDTEAIVNKYTLKEPRFSYHLRPPNRKAGGNAARAYGFEKSTGTWVCWFDSDDLMQPTYIEDKLQLAQKHSDTDVVIAKTAHYNADFTQRIGVENRTKPSEDYLTDFVLQKVKWYMCDGLWKRSFLENKTLFDEDLRVGQDVDFHIRRLLEQPKIIILDKVLTYYRRHPDNLTTGVDQLEKGRELRLSSLNAMQNLIKMLNEENRLSDKIKLFYLRAASRYLPYFYKVNQTRNKLLSLMKKCSFLSIKVGIIWIKFILAWISLRLFGKGRILLK